MIRKILFATDFSPLSNEALRYTAEIARKTGAGIVGLFALKRPASIYSLAPAEDGYDKSLEESSESRLRAFLALPELRGVPVQPRLYHGLPEEGVNQVAAAEKADLIVVGKHSRSALERFFLGSNTEKILRLARTPVLVVPPVGPRSARWNPIACGVDFSLVSKKALHFATQLARQQGARLLVIHVVDVEPVPEGIDINDELRHRVLDSWTNRAGQRLEEMVRAAAAPPETEQSVLTGKPSAVILRKAEEAGSDLLVIGSRGDALQEWTGLGSTASSVLRAAHLPTLLVPG